MTNSIGNNLSTKNSIISDPSTDGLSRSTSTGRKLTLTSNPISELRVLLDDNELHIKKDLLGLQRSKSEAYLDGYISSEENTLQDIQRSKGSLIDTTILDLEIKLYNKFKEYKNASDEPEIKNPEEPYNKSESIGLDEEKKARDRSEIGKEINQMMQQVNQHAKSNPNNLAIIELQKKTNEAAKKIGITGYRNTTNNFVNRKAIIAGASALAGGIIALIIDAAASGFFYSDQVEETDEMRDTQKTIDEKNDDLVKKREEYGLNLASTQIEEIDQLKREKVEHDMEKELIKDSDKNLIGKDNGENRPPKLGEYILTNAAKEEIKQAGEKAVNEYREYREAKEKELQPLKDEIDQLNEQKQQQKKNILNSRNDSYDIFSGVVSGSGTIAILAGSSILGCTGLSRKRKATNPEKMNQKMDEAIAMMRPSSGNLEKTNLKKDTINSDKSLGEVSEGIDSTATIEPSSGNSEKINLKNDTINGDKTLGEVLEKTESKASKDASFATVLSESHEQKETGTTDKNTKNVSTKK